MTAGNTEGRAASSTEPREGVLTSSKITVSNPQDTIRFIRQAALSKKGGVTMNDLVPTTSNRNEHIENSCVLTSRYEGGISVIGHFDMAKYGLSLAINKNYRMPKSPDFPNLGSRDSFVKIKDDVEEMLKKKYAKYTDDTGATFIKTAGGFILALNDLVHKRPDYYSSSDTQVSIDLTLALSSALVKEGYGKIAPIEDDAVVSVTPDNMQQYLDEMVGVFDSIRDVLAKNGINIEPIKKNIISRPERETTLTDKLRAQLGDISENFTIAEPKKGFEDVVGRLELLKELRAIVTVLSDPEAKNHLLRTPSGVLLQGPPGCGKTLIAEAVAKESGCKFLYMQPSALFEVQEASDLVRALFDEIEKEDRPVMIFVDEADSFFRRRDMQSPRRGEIVSTFLTQLDGLGRRSKKAFLVCATNAPDLMDPAIRRSGRLDYTFEVGPPTPDDRKDLLRHFARLADKNDTKSLFDVGVFTEKALKEFAEETQDTERPLVHADIEVIINDALIKRYVKGKERGPITLADVLSSVRSFKANRNYVQVEPVSPSSATN